jgi:hypothetical protein
MAAVIVRAAVVLSLALNVAAVALTARGDWEWLFIIVVPFVLLGALMASKRRENPIGWLYLAFGTIGSLVLGAQAYAWQGLVEAPGSLPAANLAASIGAHLWHPCFGLLVFSFLLFPRGQLLSPRWRWVAWTTVVVYGLLLLSGPFESSYLKEDSGLPGTPLFHGTVDHVASAIFSGALILNVGLLVVAGCSLVLRLRRSHGEERQQVKVFVYAVAFVLFFFPVGLFGLGGAPVYLFPLIPTSAAVAILRYRLYDIDVVINRTLVYGGLTAILAGAYLGSVLVLQLLLSPSSDLAIAGSTLAVAALFRPMRTRLQALVDRRFYRSRYDAQRTLEGFSARLRNEVALEAMEADLSAVVREAVHPAHVSLWLVRR